MNTPSENKVHSLTFLNFLSVFKNISDSDLKNVLKELDIPKLLFIIRDIDCNKCKKKHSEHKICHRCKFHQCFVLYDGGVFKEHICHKCVKYYSIFLEQHYSTFYIYCKNTRMMVECPTKFHDFINYKKKITYDEYIEIMKFNPNTYID